MIEPGRCDGGRAFSDLMTLTHQGAERPLLLPIDPALWSKCTKAPTGIRTLSEISLRLMKAMVLRFNFCCECSLIDKLAIHPRFHNVAAWPSPGYDFYPIAVDRRFCGEVRITHAITIPPPVSIRQRGGSRERRPGKAWQREQSITRMLNGRPRAPCPPGLRASVRLASGKTYKQKTIKLT